jgi:hypothetical protein
LLKRWKANEKVKVLTLMMMKVTERNIRKNTELIHLYLQMSDMDGQLSAYMPKEDIDGLLSVYVAQQAIWMD